ncbi:hypothetical protein EYF80_004353 [Liparis tanakae]|uniref:Uncharacterized protein n=1 Tax=Liparis tanakae TaxID=230148 RepID=A0A4Z2J5Z0_9TELE|nr:hypothetical protein EYF80_004353 [Liparis tanakae]
MKVKEMSWFQKGSFSEMESLPTRALRLGLSDRSLTWLVLAPIARYWLHSARLASLHCFFTRHKPSLISKRKALKLRVI